MGFTFCTCIFYIFHIGYTLTAAENETWSVCVSPGNSNNCGCDQTLTEPDNGTIQYKTRNKIFYALYNCENTTWTRVCLEQRTRPTHEFKWNGTAILTCETPENDSSTTNPTTLTASPNPTTVTSTGTTTSSRSISTSHSSSVPPESSSSETTVTTVTTTTEESASEATPTITTSNESLTDASSSISSTHRNHSSMNIQGNYDDSKDGSSQNTIIAASTVVAGVVILAIVIATVIIFRRRRNTRNNTKNEAAECRYENGAYEPTYASIDDEPTVDSVPDTDSGYADIEVNEIPLDGDYNHIGSIPARHAAKPNDGIEHKSNLSDDYSHISPGGHQSSTADDSSYSHIGGVGRSKISASISTERDKDLTYDHLASEPSMKRHQPHVSDDHSAIATDCEYNHINDVTPKLHQTIAEPDTETYNHISTKVQESCSSKNTVQQEFGPKQPYTYATVCKTKTNKELETDDCDQVDDGGPISHAYFVLEKQF